MAVTLLFSVLQEAMLVGLEGAFSEFMDAIKIHIPEDWIIVEMTEVSFKEKFFQENHSVIRTASAYYWLNDDYRVVFCCKRKGTFIPIPGEIAIE
jgi:hypothetical protein